MTTARHLERLCRRRRDVEIDFVSRDNSILMTPLLFEVCSGALDARHCSFRIRAFLGSARFVEAAVQGVDLERRVVHLRCGGVTDELAYDQLVIALGRMTNRSMIPGSEHAFTFKTLANALRLRNHIIERFERADVEPDPDRKRRQLTFVIIGGGLVGVELFGELTAFADGIAPLYQHVDRDEVRFILLQGGERIMPEIDPKPAAYGTEVLRRRRGADIRTGEHVQAIEPGQVDLPGETINAETIVLAAGIIPNPVVAALPVERDRRGRIVVDGAMRCESRPEVWARGDSAAVAAPDGQPYPSLAQHALRDAKGLAGNIVGALDGRRPQPFVYAHFGDDGLAGTRQSVRPARQGPGARRPGVVCPAHVLSAPDAGLAPAGPHHDPLVLCAVVPARHRQDQPGQRGRRTPPRSGGHRGGRRARGTGGGPTRG
jgi:NADH dehydrogenase